MKKLRHNLYLLNIWQNGILRLSRFELRIYLFKLKELVLSK